MLRNFLLVVLFFWISGGDARFDETTENPLNAHYQLPRVAKVHHYELFVAPFFPFPGVYDAATANMTFNGNIRINFTITNETEAVWLNSEGLTLRSLRLHDDRASVQPISSFHLDPIKNQIKLTPVSIFPAGGNFVLEVDYHGPLVTTDDGGFFFCTYNTTTSGEQKTIVSTVFEPAMARRMFPCFDDPFWKAAFQLTVVYPTAAQIFHNTLEQTTTQLTDGRSKTVFKKTPPMSTYLFGLTIGVFASVSAVSKKSHVPIRSVVFPEYLPYIGDTAQKSANCIDAMETLVNVPYPLDKLDNVDVHDFYHGGGIEEWGQILYTDVLINLPSAMGVLDDYDVYATICHENAHQWTGDLVTASHWGLEFLHESFADYFYTRTLQIILDDPDYLEADFVYTRQYAFEATIHLNHSIATHESHFDGVTYSAGSCVLRQLEGILGQTTFLQGVNVYLTTHEFGNANLEQLEAALESVAPPYSCRGTSISDIAEDYFTQLYYPIVRVDIQDGEYKLQQEAPLKSGGQWTVPLFVQDAVADSNYTIYLKSNGELCLPNGRTTLDATNPLVFNREGLAFATVKYEEAAWEHLMQLGLDALDQKTLLALLIDELDRASPKELFRAHDLITRLLSTFGGDLLPQLVDVALGAAFKDEAWQKSILESVYPHVNWTPTALRESHLAASVAPLAVKLDVGDARTKAAAAFQQLKTACNLTDATTDLETCNTINPSVRVAVYCQAAISGERDFLRQYQQDLQVDTHFFFRRESERVDWGLGCQATGFAPYRHQQQRKVSARRRFAADGRT
ncbi:hypothetical protein M3Y99_01018300 [Aphelenchoides fujianensis]|nr:hypothetical protein M3Y99_01018300 [Aphelenchoides fujianensis]